jgi:hypothetical protein
MLSQRTADVMSCPAFGLTVGQASRAQGDGPGLVSGVRPVAPDVEMTVFGMWPALIGLATLLVWLFLVCPLAAHFQRRRRIRRGW